MIKLGIIGYPLAHSLSSVMHEAALKEMGLEGEYQVLETPPDELVSRIKQLKVQGFKGFNVTIPLKVSIIPFLSTVDDFANVASAVNTVLIDDNKNLIGYNTDIYGFVQAIPQEQREALRGKTAAIIGSGGAARAVATGLAYCGIKELVFYARNKEKSEQLESIINRNFAEVQTKFKDFNEYANLENISIVVNTTPLGMYGKFEGQSPLTKRAIESLPDNAIVYDLIYRPKVTPLLQYAQNRDLITVDGTEMLVLQGAKALSLWTNQEIPVNTMRQALLKHLEH